ncbi:MAG: photosystem II oxygen evolving complex protein PsbP, partial [Cyanobacteria bacterium P01_E01_bin.43]
IDLSPLDGGQSESVSWRVALDRPGVFRLTCELDFDDDLPDDNLASVVVRRDKLFTFNASTEEERWDKVSDMMKQAVASFAVD